MTQRRRLADRETRAPATAATPFPIFAITHVFVGALAVKLAQDGRLSLDDPLSRTLPDWPNADRITLRMLLNQTSGVGSDQRRLERDTEARPRAIWTAAGDPQLREAQPARRSRREVGVQRRELRARRPRHRAGDRGSAAAALRELILDPLELQLLARAALEAN